MKWIPFDPEAALAALVREHVDFIVIGGYAAALWGSSALTNDADICPRHDPDNADRLAAALRTLDARIYSDAIPEGLPFDCSGTFILNMSMLNLICASGRLDVSFEPAGGGYDVLIDRAAEFELDGLVIKVASLDDIIRSKRAANRPKDQLTLPILEALRDELDAQSGAGPQA